MKLLATRKLIIAGVIILLIEGCSSSTFNQRYGSKEENKSKTYTENAKTSSEKDSIDFSEIFEDTEFDEPPPPEAKKDIPKLLKKYFADDNHSGSSIVTSEREKVVMEIIKYIDTPYKYGGNSDKGIDCSAFTQTIFSNVFTYLLPRSAREQYSTGYEIDRDNLNFGDLVFFDTRRRVKPGHVGIYIGDNLFAHASRKMGVTVSSLDEDYYSRRFMGGRRLDDIKFNNGNK
jgi:lipoprotein Spr